MSDRAWLASLIGVLLLPYVWAVYADPDLFWHVRTGLLVLELGSVPMLDPFSYTHAAAAWTDHEWLSDALQAWLWSGLGNAGLLLLRNALLAVATGALVVLCWRRCPSPALLAIVFACVMPLLAGFLSTRPHSFTYAFVPLLLLALDRAGERPVWLWSLPVLVVVWVNLHAGFALGWGVAGMGIASLALGLERGPRAPLGTAVAAGVLVLLAPLANAHSVDLLRYVWTEMGATHAGVYEWRPPTGVLWGLWGLAAVLPLACVAGAGRRPRATEFTTFLIVTFLTTRHAKFLVLMVLVGLVVAFDALPELWRRLEPRLARPRLARPRLARVRLPQFSRAGSLALAAAFGIASMLGNLDLLARHPLGVGLEPERWPVQAVAWLRDHETGPRVLTNMTWGNLALWHLTPERKVALDGRNTAVYDDAWVDGFIGAWVAGDLDRLLGAHGADVLLVGPRGPLYERALDDPAWVRAFEDPVAAVFVPRGHAPAAPVELTTLPRAIEFPGL